MNAEEQFEEWWSKNNNLGSEYYFASQVWMEAYRLGQLQGMEESAKICLNILPQYADGDECAEAIRQAANAFSKEI